MRASTLFAVTIAILLGLAAAITVKVAGYLSAPAVAPQPKLPEINVLVAARNLYKGDMIDGGWVTVRPLRANELQDYEQNKDKYLPPVANAAVLRIPVQNIEADTPILKDYLLPLSDTKPGSISTRVLPNMRAVNLAVPKEQSVGGLIQVGEWVDVLFTTQIFIDGASTTRTAAIAHKQRVIAKRDTLYQIFGHLPDDKPVHYTLEMNPYRAALVEFCRTKGILTLISVSSAEQKSLEERRVAAANGGEFQPVSFAPPKMEDSAEYQDEDDRVDAVNKGEASIGTRDLVRIFNLQTPEPPRNKDVPKPITIETLNGNKRMDPARFNTDGSVYVDPHPKGTKVTSNDTAPPSQNGIGFSQPDLQFQMPGEKKCLTCKKKRDAANGSGSVAP